MTDLVGNIAVDVEDGNGGGFGVPPKKIRAKRKTLTRTEKDLETLKLKKFLVAFWGFKDVWIRRRIPFYTAGEWEPVAAVCGFSSGREAYEYFKKAKAKIRYQLEQFQKSGFGGLGTKMNWIAMCKTDQLPFLFRKQSGFKLWPYCDYLAKKLAEEKFGIHIEYHANVHNLMERRIELRLPPPTCPHERRIFEMKLGNSGSPPQPPVQATSSDRRTGTSGAAQVTSQQGTPHATAAAACSQNYAGHGSLVGQASAFAQNSFQGLWGNYLGPGHLMAQDMRLSQQTPAWAQDLAVIKTEPDSTMDDLQNQSHNSGIGETSRPAAGALLETETRRDAEGNEASSLFLNGMQDYFRGIFQSQSPVVLNGIKREIDDEGQASSGAGFGLQEHPASVNTGTPGPNQMTNGNQVQPVLVRIPIYNLPRGNEAGTAPYEERAVKYLQQPSLSIGSAKSQKMQEFFNPLPRGLKDGDYNTILERCLKLLDYMSKAAKMAETVDTNEMLEEKVAEMFANF